MRGANSSRRSVVVCSLAALTLLTLDGRGNGLLDSIRFRAVDEMQPVFGATESVFEPFQNAWNGLLNYGELKDENEALRAELDELRGQKAQLDADVARKEQLYALLDIDWVGDLPTVNATVIGARPSNFDQTIQIDKGSNFGIRVGLPVITAAGLVGRIVAPVTENTASVRLITDLKFRAGVRIDLDPGIVKGQGLGELLQVVNVEPPAQGDLPTVRKGDVVVTNGVDESIFPRDIPVGRVSKVRERGGGLELEIEVEPIVDLDRLDVVQVVGYFPKT